MFTEPYSPFDDDRSIPVIPEGLLAKTPEAQHKDEFKNFDRRELFRMPDKMLAEWQSKHQTHEPQWRLAEHEWQRRLTAEQIRASLIVGKQSALFAVIASIVGAVVGSVLTLLVQGLSR
jgi:hypothetical protein